MADRVDIVIRQEGFSEKLEELQKVYNINSNAKLIQHIVELELQRFWIKSDEKKEV